MFLCLWGDWVILLIWACFSWYKPGSYLFEVSYWVGWRLGSAWRAHLQFIWHFLLQANLSLLAWRLSRLPRECTEAHKVSWPRRRAGKLSHLLHSIGQTKPQSKSRFKCWENRLHLLKSYKVPEKGHRYKDRRKFCSFLQSIPNHKELLALLWLKSQDKPNYVCFSYFYKRMGWDVVGYEVG